MAEIIFANICKKHKRNDIIIKGAGTDTENGLRMSSNAIDALVKCGEKIGKKLKLSTCWDDSMLAEFDHIICMTKHHAHEINPKGNHKNVYTLDDITGCGDIFDPWCYPIDVYIEVCKQLQQSLQILYDRVCRT